MSVVNLARGQEDAFPCSPRTRTFWPIRSFPAICSACLSARRKPRISWGATGRGWNPSWTSGPLLKDGKIVSNPPSQGYGGYILKKPYAEVAHFLTVDRMLSGFRERHYYLDGDRSQAQSALVAMRRQVRDKSVQIALFQHQEADEGPEEEGEGTGGRGRRVPSSLWAPSTREGLQKACEAVDKEFQERVECVRSGSTGEDSLPLDLGMDAIMGGAGLARRDQWRLQQGRGVGLAALPAGPEEVPEVPDVLAYPQARRHVGGRSRPVAGFHACSCGCEPRLHAQVRHVRAAAAPGSDRASPIMWRVRSGQTWCATILACTCFSATTRNAGPRPKSIFAPR